MIAALGAFMRKVFLGLAAISAAFFGSASAAIKIVVTQTNPGTVTAEYEGALDLTDANLLRASVAYVGVVNAAFTTFNFGNPPGASNVLLDYYELTSSESFGPGSSLTGTSSFSGDPFSLAETGFTGVLIPSVGVEAGYQSGTDISGLITFSGTLASLGLTEGTYTYGLPNDTIILFIGDVPMDPIPLPGAAVLFAPAFVGALSLRKRRLSA